jgi:hypothetical protein
MLLFVIITCDDRLKWDGDDNCIVTYNNNR